MKPRSAGSYHNPTNRATSFRGERSSATAPAPPERAASGSSFAARFGRVILQDGIAAIPSCLFHFQGKLDLSCQQVWFVSYVLSHKWDADLPYPGLHKMARSVGMSYVNLLRIRKSLVERSLLQVHERYTERGAPAPGAYDFAELFRILEEMILDTDSQDKAATHNPVEVEGLRREDTRGLDPSFAARYGRVITRYGVAAVPRAIFTRQADLELTPQHAWFISYIFSFRWTTALPYPSLVKMAHHTGYSRSQIHVIKSELEAMGYLRTVGRYAPEGGQDTNAYDFTGLLDSIKRLLDPNHSEGHDATEPPQADQNGFGNSLAAEQVTTYPPGAPADKEPRAKRRGRRSATTPDVREAEATEAKNSAGQREQTDDWGSNKDRIGGSNTDKTDGVNHRLRPVVAPTGQGVVKTAGHEVESSHIEHHKRDDSKDPSRNKIEGGTDSPGRVPGIKRELVFEGQPSIKGYSPYIAAVISDLSSEFGDSDHTLSNVTQAQRLWVRSGLELETFVERVHKCKRRTQRANAHNRMAFFFATLRESLTEPAE